MRRLRWGILSTANIGRVAVIPAIQASTNGEVVAIGSRDAGRARAFGEAAGIPVRHGSYQALVDDPSVDAIYLPVPNSLHREWTIKAAERGKHVLCEKPMALSAAECREMGRAATANGVKLMEAFLYRFHPRTRRVVELVRSGSVGELRVLRSAFTFRLSRPNNIRLDPDLGGGALMDVGCYCVNLSRTVAGVEPVEAQAWANWGPTGVDVELTGALRFPSGVVAQFDCALSLERREWFEIAGTDATLRVDAAYLPGTDEVTIEESRGRAPAIEHRVSGADEYREMVEHFADAVLHDRAVRYPPAEAAANMRVIEALYRSARDGGRPTSL
jgi:D-xylose 1-dehydrogenase (NADP+, D-xylono-1,5-lactone-forming)